MSGINECHWYNPCSWFNCCRQDQTGEREPLKGGEGSRSDSYTTLESQRRHVSTPGNTPTKSPSVKGEAVTKGQQWE